MTEISKRAVDKNETRARKQELRMTPEGSFMADKRVKPNVTEELEHIYLSTRYGQTRALFHR